jgi:hypothetical protein
MTVTFKDRVPTPTPKQQFNDVKALLSEDDQFLLADIDVIGLANDAEVSDLPPHIQSKIFSVVSQTSRVHLNDVAWFETVHYGRANLPMKIDSGAALNVMSLMSFISN